MDFFRRRKGGAPNDQEFLAKALTKYVSSDAAEKFKAGGTPDRPRLEERTGTFLVVNARDRPPSEIDALHERIAAALPKDVIVWDTMMPLLLVGTTGMIAGEAKPMVPMVDRLMSAMTDDVRVVYGDATCAVGTYGGSIRLGHGTIIPGFNSILRELLDLDFGTSKEVFPGRT